MVEVEEFQLLGKMSLGGLCYEGYPVLGMEEEILCWKAQGKRKVKVFYALESKDKERSTVVCQMKPKGVKEGIKVRPEN